jgi:hypothetical protein
MTRMNTDLHVWQEPYVWATSTGATVDTDTIDPIFVFDRKEKTNCLSAN